jgi:hypothetical protein
MTDLLQVPQAATESAAESWANFPGSNFARRAVNPCAGSPLDAVGAEETARQGKSTQQFSLDHELELHIEDAHHQYRIAYERFELHGCPHDRDEALLHLHRMNEAIVARSPAVLAARHAEFEQRISEGVDYFQSAHAHELAMGRCA